jgi:hypothetical protein
MNSKMMKNVGLVVLVVVLVIVAVYFYQQMTLSVSHNSVLSDPMMHTEDILSEEQFAEHMQHQEAFTEQNMQHKEAFQNPAEAQQMSDPASVEQSLLNNNNQLPSECYPKDVLTSSDLLPRDANSLHAQVVPSGQGALSDQNFLTAGYHIGINTVGQTLRNANRQLRSEPPNPQSVVSPWLQSTIEPDINRRPLEIGSQ